MHALIAWCHEQRYLRGGLREEVRAPRLRHARAAIAAGGDDAPALAIAGFVIGVLEHDFAVALDAIDRSLALKSLLGPGLEFQRHHARLEGRRSDCGQLMPRRRCGTARTIP